jgi:hypothetical protein
MVIDASHFIDFTDTWEESKPVIAVPYFGMITEITNTFDVHLVTTVLTHSQWCKYIL